MTAGKSRKIFFTTVLLLLFAFAAGMLMGKLTGSSKVSEIEMFIKNNELNTESYLIEQQMMENFGDEECGLAGKRLENLGSELWNIGKSLSPDNAEENLGSESYRFMKMKYHLMQIRTYILMHDLKKNCNSTGNVVLFYFSKNDPASKEQGDALDRAVADYNISVFAIEYNYSPELRFMEEYYNITSAPSLVIGFGRPMPGPVQYEDVAREIGR